MVPGTRNVWLAQPPVVFSASTIRPSRTNATNVMPAMRCMSAVELCVPVEEKTLLLHWVSAFTATHRSDGPFAAGLVCWVQASTAPRASSVIDGSALSMFGAVKVNWWRPRAVP